MKTLVAWAVVMAGVCAVAVAAGLLTENSGRQVGLYTCSADRSACVRLIWTNSLAGCRASKAEYEGEPIAGEQLVCIRLLSDFEAD